MAGEYNVRVNLSWKSGSTVAVLLLTTLLFGQSPTEPVEASVCKLIAEPAVYYGRLVRVRAVYVSSFEMEGLHDPNCSPNKWNGSDTLGRLDMHNLIEDKEAEEFERFAYATTGCCGTPEYKVTATFTGRIDGCNIRRSKRSSCVFTLQSVSNVVAEEPDVAVWPTRSSLPDRLPDNY
jgi:hypothetical protein